MSSYVPCYNGKVASVCKEAFHVMRSFGSRFRIPEADYTKYVLAIQSIIKNWQSRRISNHVSITVHTGMKPGNPLSDSLTMDTTVDADSLDQAQVMQNLKMENMLDDLDKMHKDVTKILSETREKAVVHQNRKTNVRPYGPPLGADVVISRTRGSRTNMYSNWVGPFPFIRILSYFAVEIEQLLIEERTVVNVSRSKQYGDSFVVTPVELDDITSFTDILWYSVNKIKYLHDIPGLFEVLVASKGLRTASRKNHPHGDYCEPLAIILEDFFTKFQDILNNLRTPKVLRKAKSFLVL